MIASVVKEEGLAVATGSEGQIFSSLSFCKLLVVVLIHPVTYPFRTTGQVLGVSLSGAVLQAVLIKNCKSAFKGQVQLEVSQFGTICPN